MSTVSAATNTLFEELEPQSEQRVPKKVLDRDDFMLLFIKQLPYQDPMKPMETDQMAMQLAMFNQVDQLFNLTDKFEEVVEAFQHQEMVAFSSMVGRLVKVESSTGRVEEGRFLGATLKLEEAASKVKVKIFDEKGTLVKTIDLGSLPAGEHRISWDATNEQGETVSDGNYQLRFEWENEEVEASVETIGRVTGAVLGETPQLVINGSQKIDLQDVLEIVEQGGKS